MKFTYTQHGHGGIDNCEKCHKFIEVLELTRSDGKACLLCLECWNPGLGDIYK